MVRMSKHNNGDETTHTKERDLRRVNARCIVENHVSLSERTNLARAHVKLEYFMTYQDDLLLDACGHHHRRAGINTVRRSQKEHHLRDSVHTKNRKTHAQT